MAWRTAIFHNFGKENTPRIQGYALIDLIKQASFAESVFLILKGELPKENERKMTEAILVAGLDHGPGPVSTQTARLVASGGNPLHTAAAAGLLALGDHHGGAIENCARLLQEARPAAEKDPAPAAEAIVRKTLSNNQRLPGFGHKLYSERDPRAGALIERARDLGFNGAYVGLALALERILARQKGRRLPLNNDGAIAALISEMGFDWRLGKGFYAIARLPGLVAHAYEELTREKPVAKRLDNQLVEYDGPPPRPYPKTKSQKTKKPQNRPKRGFVSNQN